MFNTRLSSLEALESTREIVKGLEYSKFVTKKEFTITKRDPNDKENALTATKSSFPSRRSSIGVKALSHEDHLNINDSWIKEKVKDDDIEGLFHALNLISDNTYDDTENRKEIDSLNSKYMQLLSRKAAHEDYIKQHHENTNDIVSKKILTATRDLNILIEERDSECNELQKEIKFLETNVNKLISEKKKLESINSNELKSEAKNQRSREQIEQLKEKIRISRAQLEVDERRKETLKEKNRENNIYLPCQTEFLQREIENIQQDMRMFEEETTRVYQADPTVIKLQSDLQEAKTALEHQTCRLRSRKELPYKWKKATIALINKVTDKEQALPLCLLVENNGKMTWDDLEKQVREKIAADSTLHCECISLLYDLIANRRITIDNSQTPRIVSLLM